MYIQIAIPLLRLHFYSFVFTYPRTPTHSPMSDSLLVME